MVCNMTRADIVVAIWQLFELDHEQGSLLLPTANFYVRLCPAWLQTLQNNLLHLLPNRSTRFLTWALLRAMLL